MKGIINWCALNAVDMTKAQALAEMGDRFGGPEKTLAGYEKWRASFVGGIHMKSDGAGERQLAFAIGLRLVDDLEFPEFMFDAFIAVEQELSHIFDHIGITQDMLKSKAYGHWNNGGREDALKYIREELPNQKARQLKLSQDNQEILDSPWKLRSLRAERKRKGRKWESMQETKYRIAMNAHNQRNAASSTAYAQQKCEVMFNRIEQNAMRYNA